MVSPVKFKKASIVFSITFILVTLMSTLYLVDASKFVKCRHIGVCEFLEVLAICNTGENVKSNLINNRRYHHPFSWLKNSIYSLTSYQLTSIKNHALLAHFYVLKRYINHYIQKIRLHLHHEKTIKILINKIYIAYKKSPILSAKRIHIITSSVIRS